VNNVDKNLFICHLEKLTVTQKRIVILAPLLAEKEIGFETWVLKVMKLSTELSIPVIMFGNDHTYNSAIGIVKKYRLSSTISFIPYTDWEDFIQISKHVNEDDLLIFISARVDDVSYQKYLHHIPSKLEKHFQYNNKVIVFPQQNFQSNGKKSTTNGIKFRRKRKIIMARKKRLE
jgi:hypothetical protein